SGDTGAVFFFQAEDGIRDKLVTGVQTCALPISRTRKLKVLDDERAPRAGRIVPGVELQPALHQQRLAFAQIFRQHIRLPAERGRSEERRVGKECRSRWARAQ